MYWKASDESGDRLAQRLFGFTAMKRLRFTRRRADPQLRLHPLRFLALHGGAKLAQLFLDFPDNLARLLPVEADPGGLLLQPMGAQEGRQLARDAVQKRCATLGVEPLRLLDLLPIEKNLLGGIGLDIAEHVGMAPDEFFGDRPGGRPRCRRGPASSAMRA